MCTVTLTDRYPNRANHHADKTVLWLSLATLRVSPAHIVALEERHDSEGDTESNPDGDERQTDKTVVPVVVASEYNGVTEEEGILQGKC